MREGTDVHVCEVGLRDGLQNIQSFFPTDQKIEWIAAEAAAGVPEIEVCSFVPPKLIPQFQDARDVCAAALTVAEKNPDLVISALTPNLKGAENGIAAGVHKLRLFNPNSGWEKHVKVTVVGGKVITKTYDL